jgi:hypothetical protein
MHRLTAVGFLGLALALGAGADPEFQAIFDGSSGQGWITNEPRQPVPKANVQRDGLNPHKSGGYLVVHDKPHGDFVFDFDYKLTRRCNSGVFIRVSDLKDPVNSGLEIALLDTTRNDMHTPGAFYDLVAPRLNAQKPAGEWNHMTITAKGPRITVVLNGQEVSEIDLNQFTEPGKRLDGTKHKFTARGTGVVIKDLPRRGYLGFQDHGSDCWFKNIKVKDLN